MRNFLLCFLLSSLAFGQGVVGPKGTIGPNGTISGNAGGGGGGGGTWSKAQNMVSASGSGTAVTVALAGAPTVNDTLTVHIGTVTSEVATSITCNAGSGHNFTMVSQSGANAGAGLFMYGGYYPQATSGSVATISCTLPTTTGFWVVLAGDFTDTGGTPTFDQAVGSSNASASGTNINLPSVTPAVTGELLVTGIIPNNLVTAPTQGSTLGVWTGGVIHGNGAATEYLLSSTNSATVPNATDNTSSDTYASLILAIKP